MKDYVKNVCGIGKRDDCCRYLVMSSSGKFECVKYEDQLKPKRGDYMSLKEQLDLRVAMKTITSRGDNCNGKSIEELNE